MELGVEESLDSELLRNARTLFARAIETPGGLKIQTIHSFCSSLLRRFPLEAGVSPLFTEMEDRAAAMLRDDIVTEMAEGDDSDLIKRLAGHFTGESLEDLTAEIVRNREAFVERQSVEQILTSLGQPGDQNESAIEAQVFAGGEAGLLTDLIHALRDGGINDKKAADKLATISTLSFGAIERLEGAFLTGEAAKSPFSAKLGSIPSKAAQKKHPSIAERIEPLMLRVEAAREARVSLLAAQRSAVLSEFGCQVS